MPLNEQLFRQKAKEAGVSENEINAYLQNKGVSQPQQTGGMFGSQPVSGGFLGYVAPALSTLPQAIGLNIGARQQTKTIEGISGTLQSQADLAQSLLKQIQKEKDPMKKERLRKRLKEIGANSQQLSGTMNELASGKGLEESTAIKLGAAADIPGLSTDPGRSTQQILGRSIRQIGSAASPVLGSTGAGAVYGAGTGIERGSSPLGVAVESAGTATAFKIFGFGADKLAVSQFGQRVMTSPVGSTVLNVANKVFSPFVAKPSAPGTFGSIVDTSFKNFGSAIDKVYSPSTYLKPIGSVLKSAGQQVGLTKTPEQQLQGAQQRVTKYWGDAGNRYQSSIRYDKNSPEILGREGIIPRQAGGAMATGEEATILRTKAGAEHSLMNRILEESRIYGSVEDARGQAVNFITQKFKGVERETAINAFNKQFNALLAQNKGQLVGDGRAPMKLINDIKSYMWSQGYASKLAPKSEQVASEAMRVGGNAIKTYINTTFQASDPAMADVIIGLNQHSGELFQAAKFLEFMNGKKLPYGLIGRHFARVAGAIIGSSAGPVGGVAGTLTADQLVTILQNPKFSVGKASILIAQLRKTNPKVVEDAFRMITNLEKQAASRLFLPGTAGASSQINLPQTGVLKGQQNIKPPLVGGEIPKTTKLIKGVGGSERPFDTGNILGKGDYWFEGIENIDKAKSFGPKILEKLSSIPEKKIFNIKSQEELLSLYKKVIIKYPKLDIQDAIPKYLKGLGYKAARATFDPMGGINIFK